MGLLYLGGPIIQEVDGEMMMGLSIYGVAVMDGSLYSRFYGICRAGQVANRAHPALKPARRLQRFIIRLAGFKAGRPTLKWADRLSSRPGLQSGLNIYIMY